MNCVDDSERGLGRDLTGALVLVERLRHLAHVRMFQSHMGRPHIVVAAGQRFGRLVITGPANRRVRDGREQWHCLCDCGRSALVTRKNLLQGSTRSCGCFKDENRRTMSTTHGLSATPEYGVWRSMISRCHSPTDRMYPYYGARGITVCDRWRKDVRTFVQDMGRRPFRGAEIERTDSARGYEPDNVVWATRLEQANNHGRTIRITHQGRTQSLSSWCRELGLDYKRTRVRIRFLGWSFERAISTPARRTSRERVSGRCPHCNGVL